MRHHVIFRAGSASALEKPVQLEVFSWYVGRLEEFKNRSSDEKLVILHESQYYPIYIAAFCDICVYIASLY